MDQWHPQQTVQLSSIEVELEVDWIQIRLQFGNYYFKLKIYEFGVRRPSVLGVLSGTVKILHKTSLSFSISSPTGYAPSLFEYHYLWFLLYRKCYISLEAADEYLYSAFLWNNSLRYALYIWMNASCMYIYIWMYAYVQRQAI